MTTVYTNEQKYAGQTSITYDEISIEYDEESYTYDGIVGTIYTNQTKN